MIKKAEAQSQGQLSDSFGPNTAEQQALADSFGPDWRTHLPGIKQDIKKLRTADLHVFDSNGQNTQNEASQTFRIPAAYAFTSDPTGHDPVTYLGNRWHAKPDPRHRAGVMVHELSHAVLKTGDHGLKVAKNRLRFINSKELKIRKAKKKQPMITLDI